MSSVDIAVLIPSYKPGEYFDRLLSALDNQTLHSNRFCVYICLNGPRNPYESNIFKCLESKAIRYRFFYKEEPGVSSARNFLLDKSHEPFVTFIDDDDVVSENFLENLLAVSSKEVVGVSNVYNFERTTSEIKCNYIGNAFLRLNDFESSNFAARRFFSSACAKLIHREIIGRVRFDTYLAKGEDALFMAQVSPRVLAVKKASSSTCYYVFEREGSATRKKVLLSSELTRIFYLTGRYLRMLFDKQYEKGFVISRIVATLLQLKKVIA